MIMRVTKMTKGEISWIQIKNWLAINPGKTAAIVTPRVTYIIRVVEPPDYVTQESIVEYPDKG